MTLLPDHHADPDAAAHPDSGLFGMDVEPEDAHVVLLPVPWEPTVSEGRGTARGPGAVLKASHQVDLVDPDLPRLDRVPMVMLPEDADVQDWNADACRLAKPIIAAGGAHPEDPSDLDACARVDALTEQMHAWQREEARRYLDADQLVGLVGGDHSTPFGLISELAERHDEGLGILHVDAHCDLREAYEGFAWSHASIFERVLALAPGVTRVVQVGIRDYSPGELAAVDGSMGRVRTFFDAELRSEMFRGTTWDALCHQMIERLPTAVHVSFDIDGLEPSLCPGTGTPVPGGLSWAEARHLLVVLARSGRRIVGFDLCEVGSGHWDGKVGACVLRTLIGAAMASRTGA
ncbi:MAG: arginase family protein [Acidobacteriota bacterium]